MSRKAIDLTGQTIGPYTVLKLFHGGSKRVWMCRCACGKLEKVGQAKLTKGNPKPCKACRARGTKRHLTHGKRHTPEYESWASLKQRCTNPNNHKYPRYGGRGINVCESWLNDFQAFWDDMGPRPTPNHTIHRIDNDGDYTPENCKWASRKEQCSNRKPPCKHRMHPNSLANLRPRTKGH